MNLKILEECCASAIREGGHRNEDELRLDIDTRYAKAISAVYQHGKITFDRENIENPTAYLKYPFLPLNNDTEIRLCRISGFVKLGSREYINLQIEHANLDDDPQYTALSYAWGSIDDSHPVTINGGTTLMVTKSLVSVLYRLSESAELLWTDQLCIDQYNLDERSAQVALMDRIYRQASSTIVWLGEEDDDARAVSDLISKITPLSGKFSYKEILRAVYNGKRHLWRAVASDGPESTVSVPHWKDPCWRALHDFLGRPWFSRLWVFQEYYLSKSPLFYCGTLFFSLEGLWLACALDVDSSGVLPKELTAGRKMLMDLVIYRFTGHEKLPSLATTLFTVASNLAAKDPRDKIYALLAVQPDAQRVVFPVDYTKPVVEVYTSFTKQVIVDREDLHILTYLKEEPEDQRMPGLPSWVPNWSADQSTGFYEQHVFQHYHPGKLKFNACKSIPYRHSKESAASSLAVQGHIVDHIAHKVEHEFRIFQTRGDEETYFEDNFPVSKLLEEIKSPKGEVSLNETPDAILRSCLLRTITADGFMRRVIDSAEDNEDSSAADGLSSDELDRFWSLLGDGAHRQGKAASDELTTVRDLKILTEVCEGKGLFTLQKRFLGLCPKSALPGDLIVVLHGFWAPVVLRRVAVGNPNGAGENDEHDDTTQAFKILGQCFVDGLMYGEAVDWSPDQCTNYILV